MSEKYYYNFHFVDGSTQEFEKNNDGLTSLILNPGRERVQIDDELIFLSQVIKVTVETKSQREEREKANIEAASKIKF